MESPPSIRRKRRANHTLNNLRPALGAGPAIEDMTHATVENRRRANTYTPARFSCTGYRRADGLWDVEGHLTDVKTYAFYQQRARLL